MTRDPLAAFLRKRQSRRALMRTLAWLAGAALAYLAIASVLYGPPWEWWN